MYDYYAMFQKGIESDKQTLGAYLKKLGQKELEDATRHLYFEEYRTRVHNCPDLDFDKKVQLCVEYAQMLATL